LDPELYLKYVTLVTSGFVEKNPSIQWCPSGRGCEYAAMVTPTSARTIQCSCGFVYCFNCRTEAHWPASCIEIQWWNKTHPGFRGVDPAEAENKSMEWILGHTQDCPKCRNPIEKNGGCNHLTCRACNHQYCWVCMGEWSPKHYNCKAVHHRAAKGEREDEFSKLFSADINLGFMQLWTLTDRAKSQDAALKRKIVEMIKGHVKSFRQKAAVSIALCEALLKAVEYTFLCRHIIKMTCVVGAFFHQFKVGGGKALKPEIRRLNADISFLYSMVSGPLHKLKQNEVVGAVGAIKSSVKHLTIKVGELRLKTRDQVSGLKVFDD